MKETLTKKVAGVPVWALALIGSAGLAFFLWKRSQSVSSSSPTGAASQTSTPIVLPNTGATPTPTPNPPVPPEPPVVGVNNHPNTYSNQVPYTKQSVIDSSGHLATDAAGGYWGGSYNSPPVTTPQGIFAILGPGPRGDWGPIKQAQSSGTPLFWQSAPGNFLPWTPAVGSGIPLYQMVQNSFGVGSQNPPGGNGGVTSVNNTQFSSASSPAGALSPFAQVT